jgi:hypothetical protein
MQTTLINYIRNKQKHPRGVVVAVRKDDAIHYGFSLVNPIDKWDKEKGIKIAVSRALAGEFNLPLSRENYDAIIDGFTNLKQRSFRYFKDLNPEVIDFIFED